jgi:hypothetical protein
VGKTEEGKQDDEEAKAAKMEEFLAYVNGLDGQAKSGTYCYHGWCLAEEELWHNYNSRTGHNFAVGGFTGLIIALVVFSKHCRMCEVARRRGTKNQRSTGAQELSHGEECQSPWRELVLWSTARISSVELVTMSEPTSDRLSLMMTVPQEPISGIASRLSFDAQYGDGGWIKSDHWPRVDPNNPKECFCERQWTDATVGSTSSSLSL